MNAYFYLVHDKAIRWMVFPFPCRPFRRPFFPRTDYVRDRVTALLFFSTCFAVVPPTFTDAPSFFLPSRISNETIPCVLGTYRRFFRYSLPPILLFLPSCCRLFAFPWPLLIFFLSFRPSSQLGILCTPVH